MTKPTDIPILLADFQFLTRKAIKALIDETPGFQLKAQVDHPKDLARIIETAKPELLVLDILENDPAYLDEIAAINRQAFIPILIITNTQNHDIIQSLLKAGIKGIVTKNCSEVEIVNALKAVSIGHRFYCNSILNQVMEIDLTPEESCESASLTSRELQILKLIATGNTSQKIANKLHISIHTVNSHRKNLLKKLNISSPIHLVAYAVETGLVSIDYNKR